MIRPTNYQVAFAHLTSRVKQVMVAMQSVTFGISMYNFMNGFMTGVNDTQNEMAFSTLAHVRIFNDLPEDKTDLLSRHFGDKVLTNLRNPKVIQYTEGIKNSTTLLRMVDQHPEVKGVTAQVNVNVFFQSGGTKLNGVLAGVDAFREDELFGTASYMTAGNWTDLDYRNDGVVLGTGLARKLSVGLQDNITVLTADGASKNYRVIGLIETSVGSTDQVKGFVKINSARQLISKNQSYVSDIQINIHDYTDANLVANQLRKQTNYKVESWIESNGQLQAGREMRNIIAYAVSFVILIVAGFGIYNIMNMTVNEKIKEIAILKAMGFEGTDIVQIFLVQSVIIGLVGGLVGMVIGFMVSFTISLVPFQIASLETLPMTYRLVDYGLAFVFGILIAVIGSSWGLTTTGGAKGVGQSTTTAVVTALLAIFISNFFLSWLMFQGTGSAVLGNA